MRFVEEDFIYSALKGMKTSKFLTDQHPYFGIRSRDKLSEDASRIVKFNRSGRNLIEIMRAHCQNNVAGTTLSISMFINQRLLENNLFHTE